MANISWVHRDLVYNPHHKNLQTGPDVKAVQRAINVICGWPSRGWPLIAVDGECGHQTIQIGRQAAMSIGIHLKAPGLSIYAQHLLCHPGQRTPQQKKRAKAWKLSHAHPQVNGNKVTGGHSDRDRIVMAAEAAYHHWAKFHDRFYSQPGAWTVEHGITGEPHGFRSDCSQWVTSIYWSAGAPDPNGNDFKGGYTGTLASHCNRVKLVDLLPGDLVLYGTPPYHHVELFTGPGNRTIGHGSPPVDPGDVFFMASPNGYRCPGLN
jgi:hypothetical protein